MTAVAIQHAPVDWTIFVGELDRLAEQNATVSFWLRDDDAVAPTQALERLFTVADGVPLALAVIPSGATPELADRVAAENDCAVLQHGFAHTNHAAPDERKSELGDDRPLVRVLDELHTGHARLQELFAERALPVLAPPWNRIADDVAADLSTLGITGLSRFGAVRRQWPGLRQANTHIDPIDWRGTRGHLGDTAVLGDLLGEVRRRHVDRTLRDEPIGILTHHLVVDEAGWSFLARFISETRRHPAVLWRHPAQLFAA